MVPPRFLSRHTLERAITGLAAIAFILYPAQAAAQDSSPLQLSLTPHCILRELGQRSNDAGVLGKIPEAEDLFDPSDPELACREFAVENPETLRTDPLQVGDTLDMDIIVRNPSEATVRRVRSWLTYDPNILTGVAVSTNGKHFPIITPGEADFSASEGYVKIEVSAPEGTEPEDQELLIARIQFTVQKYVPAGTIIGFYDVQFGGHSSVTIVADSEEQSGLDASPGVLHVVIAEGAESSAPSSESLASSVSSLSAVASAKAEVSSKSSASSESSSLGLKRNGDACTMDADCESNLCGSGICIPSLGSQARPLGRDRGPKRTAFSLLQVQNVRATTEGSSLFLAWDTLESSELKAYNVYYGTTSGKYIQRKTVAKDENSLTIRALPVETTYFIALRAVSARDEESAFSQEVSVTVGDPGSSTAVLSLDDLPSSMNPLAASLGEGGSGERVSVPGETGVPSTLAILFSASAIIGTAVAARRQRRIFLAPPTPHA